MAIKKMYVEIVDLLQANEDKKVKSVMAEVLELVSSKQNRNVGSTFLKSVDGEPLAIHCYYYKRWMPVVGDNTVEFGAKKSTATGLNTMCRDGVSNWTKQNNNAKKEIKALLAKLKAKEITVDDIPGQEKEIEAARVAVAKTELGFATKDEVVAYLESSGFTIATATD